MRRLALAAVLLMVALSGAWFVFFRASVATLEGEEADVYEALFRNQLKTTSATGCGAIYLSIDGKGPPAAFLSRFSRDRWLVREGSRYAADRGLLWSASQLTWLAEDRVTVRFVERVHTRLGPALGWGASCSQERVRARGAIARSRGPCHVRRVGGADSS
jgi:hypothetical protein